MTTDPFSDARIIESWHLNARPWTVAVREGRIDSRVQLFARHELPLLDMTEPLHPVTRQPVSMIFVVAPSA